MPSYLKVKESDIMRQQKRFQLESLKEAVSNNQITVNRAN
jgi:hypothetical protein